MDNSNFSHVDKSGKANMIDVGKKSIQNREARAAGMINLNSATVRLIHENQLKKGDVIAVARIAGIQAAKKTSELIPLCHPLLLTSIDVNIALSETHAKVESLIKCQGQTGVEMEALTAVSAALLAIYDMCKAVDKNMIIHDIKLISKSKSDINE